MLDQHNYYADEIDKMEQELEELKQTEYEILTMSKHQPQTTDGEFLTENSIASPEKSIGSGLF